MEILIVVFVILSLIGSISFLKPSNKMKALSAIRHIASKEGFKIGSTQILRKKFKSWTPQVAIYQIKNDSSFNDMHFVREGDALTLYAPMSLKYDKQFPVVQEKILLLPNSVLEIIFFQSNIAIVWNEMQGHEELLKIKTAILNICN
ncbi:hypothetical protein N9D92_01150 [Gammaproteobacteria bacterium]|nr:hypothetical protein [Gammaproteobacteria bacterium]